VDPHGGQGTPHEPTPTIWPVGFAIGIACLFVGLIISTIVLIVGAVLTAIFGFLWIRDATSGLRTVPAQPQEEPEPAPSAPPIPAHKGPPAMPEPGEGEVIRFPRSKMLEATTLGLGGLIGLIVTAPVLGFTILPPFLKQGHPDLTKSRVHVLRGQFALATQILQRFLQFIGQRFKHIETVRPQ